MCRKKSLYLLFISFFCITFSSMTSFLFPLHVGVDQNCFLTVGKAILEGKVLYRDIFEQKGPLLYFYHTLGLLISSHSFIGIYLIQVISFAIFLYYIGKLSDLFVEERFRKLVIAVTGAVIVTSFCYSRGDNAEEFCMPFITAGIYHLLVYINGEEKEMKGKILFLHGILAACIFWIKYTMLGFYIAWFFVTFYLTYKRNNIKKALKMAILFLSGGLVGSVPYFIYFIWNDALYDMFYVYFYSNICLYSKKVNLLQRIRFFFEEDILWNPIMMPLSLFGLWYVSKGKKICIKKEAKFAIVISYIVLYTFVFIGGTRYRYYLLILSVYTVFGVIALLLNYQEKIEKLMKCNWVNKTNAVIFFIAFLIAFSNCMPFYFKDRKYYPQIQFAEIIKQSANPTLLNYNFLDGGFYFAADVQLPETKYFCKVNISRRNLPEMYTEQERIIKEKDTEYVVVRYRKGENIHRAVRYQTLFNNYRLVSTAYESVDGYCYGLFKKL